VAKKKKYYVVWKGRNTGIFTDWPTTQAQVAGFPGAKHQSFLTKEEAETAFKGTPGQARAKSAGAAKSKTSSKSKSPSLDQFDPDFDIHIYCDGGCNPNPGECGSGVAVYESGILSALYHGLYDVKGTNNIAELNALHQAMLIADDKTQEKKAVQILSDSMYSINAMTVWAPSWKQKGQLDGKGKPLKNVDLIREMYDLFSQIESLINIEHVPAHSGIEGNELADRLSTLAIQGKVTKFVEYNDLIASELLAI